MVSRALAVLLASTTLSLVATGAAAQDTTAPSESAAVQAEAPAQDPLLAGFRAPPASARPRTWWHWMNGNVTEDGIVKDLEWMNRVGLGGVQMFDANLSTPQIVPERLVYMTPEWKKALRLAASTADRLGLEMAIAASPGWSETGGPWVPPQDGIKKLTWSETLVSGGRRFHGVLALPPATTGPFLDVAADKPADTPSEADLAALPSLYSDIAVIAYPLAAPVNNLAPTSLTVGQTALDVRTLTDARYGQGVPIPRGTPDQPTIVEVDFGQARTVRSASLFIPGAASSFLPTTFVPRLEAQDGDGTWRKIADIELSTAPTTISFPAVSARRFRLVIAYAADANKFPFTPAAGFDMAPMAALFAPKPTMDLAELRLSSEERIHQFEAKSGYAVSYDYYALETGNGAETPHVRPAGVIDLTGRMAPDGTLDWTPPKGQWRILRIGSSLTGKTNHPATKEATGLEVDKLDGAAVRRYLTTYLDMYRSAAGADLVGAHGIRALLTDSTEVGAFNWTPRLLEEFRGRRGYDPTPWLPTLTGAIVGSAAQSDGFLYDFRKTIAELHASEHYATLAEVAHENGLKVYGESLEAERLSLGDDLDMRRYADFPMAALWTYGRGEGPREVYLADMRSAASVAHLYGKNVVAAESMTSAFQPWAYAPGDLRRVVDLEFVNGINRPVIHTSVHQPVDDKQPGLSLLIFGQFFNRHETWAEMARPWIDYMARTSYLLQQGRFHADIAYFYGEEGGASAQSHHKYLADVPVRFPYDFISAKALIEEARVEGGNLVTPGGASYRVLYLGGTARRMTLPTLRKVAALVEQGATVVGLPPASSPALGENTAEYANLLKRLWPGSAVAAVGAGRVVRSGQIETAMDQLQATPDFDYDKPHPDSEILFLHRRLPDGDIYFVDNRRDRRESFKARFRVAGKAPEIWRADSGRVEKVSYSTSGGVTTVPLDMNEEESFFVVFRADAEQPAATVAKPEVSLITRLDGPWSISFQKDRGAPEKIELPELGSLSENADPRIKYFSGVATYTKRFKYSGLAQPGESVVLDLGVIGDIAEVALNGRSMGTVWHRPYRLDLGSNLRRGSNTLEIKVANLWVNRLIGDAVASGEKVTFTTIPTYTADAPLRPAGLIGPVDLLVSRPAAGSAGQDR